MVKLFQIAKAVVAAKRHYRQEQNLIIFLAGCPLHAAETSQVTAPIAGTVRGDCSFGDVMHHDDTEERKCTRWAGSVELFEVALDLFDPDGEPAAFAEPGPSVAAKTALGEQIVAVAKALLKKPVREDAGCNETKTDGSERFSWKAFRGRQVTGMTG